MHQGVKEIVFQIMISSLISYVILTNYLTQSLYVQNADNNTSLRWSTVAHAYNPSTLEGQGGWIA